MEPSGGYLGQHPLDGPFLLASVHSYSMRSDLRELDQFFTEIKIVRVDWDYGDVTIFCMGDDGKVQVRFRKDLW